MRIATLLFCRISNILYIYAIVSTVTPGNGMSKADKLFVTQAVFDIGVSMILAARTVMIQIKESLCEAPTGWSYDDLFYAVKIIDVFHPIEMISLCMPLIICVCRYIKIIKQTVRLRKLVMIALTFVACTSLLISSFVFIVGRWQDDLYLRNVALFALTSLQALLLIMLIITNTLILRHILSSAMPLESRTHQNERKITKTILLVNFCLITSWVPYYIVAVYNSLVSAEIFTTDSDTRITIVALQGYLVIGCYANAGLNATIYMTRVARFRHFLLRKLKWRRTNDPRNTNNVALTRRNASIRENVNATLEVHSNEGYGMH